MFSVKTEHRAAKSGLDLTLEGRLAFSMRQRSGLELQVRQSALCPKALGSAQVQSLVSQGLSQPHLEECTTSSSRTGVASIRDDASYPSPGESWLFDPLGPSKGSYFLAETQKGFFYRCSFFFLGHQQMIRGF